MPLCKYHHQYYYNVGDKLNTEGLVIKKVYEIGRSFTTTSGFTVDKNVLKLGDNKVTVTYDGNADRELFIFNEKFSHFNHVKRIKFVILA